jgi:putative transposase
VLVVIEHRSRRLIHYNVIAHPNATWTLQQLREAVGYEEQYRFLIHERDGIFSGQLDESIRALGIRVLKSAPHSPKMNAVCERVIGTLRRECLDWLIPLSEAQLRTTLRRSDPRRTPSRVRIGDRVTASLGLIPIFCGSQGFVSVDASVFPPDNRPMTARPVNNWDDRHVP